MLAVLHVDQCWMPEKTAEAEQVYGTTKPEHPAVAALAGGHPWYVGGRIEALEAPAHYDFGALRHTPRGLLLGATARFRPS